MQTITDIPNMMVAFLVLCLALLSFNERSWVRGHGRLIDPPSRATMWRFGFDTRADYDDNQGYCGGREQLWNRFKGRCGVCGDAWEPRPRAHERGGRYYDGTPVRYYTEGDVITVVMGITANHRGWVEFRLCPYDWPEPDDVEYDEYGEFVEVSHACLDKHVLELADGSGTRFYLPEPYKVGEYSVDVRLPYGLSCQKCLFQWKWNVANSWGTDPDGTSCIGCGKQEQFYACSDIVIESLDGRAPDYPPYVPETEPAPPVTEPPPRPPPPPRRTQRPVPPRRTQRPVTPRRTQRPVYRTQEPFPPVYSPRFPQPATYPPWSGAPDEGRGGFPTTGRYPGGYPTTGRYPSRGYPDGGVSASDRGGYPVTESGGRGYVPVTRTPATVRPVITDAPTSRKTTPRQTTITSTEASTPRKPKGDKPDTTPKGDKPDSAVPSFWKWLLMNHPVKQKPDSPVVMTRPTQTTGITTTKSWWEKLMVLADETIWGDSGSGRSANIKVRPQTNATVVASTPTTTTATTSTTTTTTTTTTPSTTTVTTTPKATVVANTTQFEVVNPIPWWAQSIKQKAPAFLFHGWETPDISANFENANVREFSRDGSDHALSIVAYSGLLGPQLQTPKRKQKRYLKSRRKLPRTNQITAAASREPANFLFPVPEPYREDLMMSPAAELGQKSRDILLTNEYGVEAVNQGFPFGAVNQDGFFSPVQQGDPADPKSSDQFTLPVRNRLLAEDNSNFLPAKEDRPFYAEELICTPAAGWTQYPQMWRWCEFHCRGGYCPPTHCMCA